MNGYLFKQKNKNIAVATQHFLNIKKYILHATVTLTILPGASCYPKVNRTAWCSNTHRHYASGVNVTVTSGFFITQNPTTCITFFLISKNVTPMMSIAKNGAGESFIHFSVRGGAAEYVAQLRALTTALSGAPLNDDDKAILGELLTSMLPDEQQIKKDRK